MVFVDFKPGELEGCCASSTIFVLLISHLRPTKYRHMICTMIYCTRGQYILVHWGDRTSFFLFLFLFFFCKCSSHHFLLSRYARGLRFFLLSLPNGEGVSVCRAGLARPTNPTLARRCTYRCFFVVYRCSAYFRACVRALAGEFG